MPPTSPSPTSTVACTLIEGEGGRFQRAGGSFGKTWQGCEKSDYYLYLPIGKVKGPHHSYKSSRLSFSITSINITQMKTHRLNIVLGCLSLVVTTVWTHKHTILFWLFQHQQLQNKALPTMLTLLHCLATYTVYNDTLYEHTILLSPSSNLRIGLVWEKGGHPEKKLCSFGFCPNEGGGPTQIFNTIS